MKNATNKTAMEELIDELKWYQNNSKLQLSGTIKRAEKLLEKEKEQIEIAFDLGRDEVTSAFIIDGEDYFNKKFKK